MFNGASSGLSAFVSAGPGFILGWTVSPHHAGALTALVFMGGAAYVVTNVITVAIAVSLYTGISMREMLEDYVRHSGPAFAIMAFIAALATSLWMINPRLELLLAGPLFALALYQRYAYRSVVATRDAETDALTGLRNHRSFQTDLREALALGASTRSLMGLVLIDIDNFKSINDRFGHQVGDDVLITLARLMREEYGDAQAYRIGGEEFALLLPDDGEQEAYTAVERLHARLWQTNFPHAEPVTVSAGIASYPSSAGDRDQLLRVADGALYWAKNHGKNRSCVYSPTVVRIYTPDELAESAERHARLKAAEGLIRVVDAKDTYAGAHSQSVSRLVEGIARAMGLDEETVEQVRLAGLLHDLGKIAIPDRILQKPGKLDPDELRDHARARRARLPAARGPGRVAGRPLDPPPPRVVGRQRLSAGTGRRGHPAGLAHHPGRRRVRRDDLRPRLPRGRQLRRGGSPSCAGAAGRSSTRAWCRRSRSTWPRWARKSPKRPRRPPDVPAADRPDRDPAGPAAGRPAGPAGVRAGVGAVAVLPGAGVADRGVPVAVRAVAGGHRGGHRAVDRARTAAWWWWRSRTGTCSGCRSPRPGCC